MILLRLEYIFYGPSGGWGPVKVYWPCAGGLTAVNAVGTELRDPYYSILCDRTSQKSETIRTEKQPIIEHQSIPKT